MAAAAERDATLSEESQPVFGADAVRAMLLASIPLLALFFIPAAESPFLIPKRALLIALTFAAFAMAAAAGALKRLPVSAFAVLALVPAATVASWIAAPRREFGVQALLLSFAGPLLAWLAASTLRTRGELAIVVALTGAAESLLVIVQWTTRFDLLGMFGEPGAAVGRMRLYGTLGNPDFAAIFIAAALPAAIAVTLVRHERRWAWVAVILVDVVALAGCASRTAVVAAIVGTAVVAWWGRFRSQPRDAEGAFTSPTMTLALLGLIAALAIPLVIARNPRPASTAARGRLLVWEVALARGAWRAPLGSGPGTFGYFYPTRLGEFFAEHRAPALVRFAGYERTANNDFVQALAETGWMGMVALVAAIVALLRRLAASARSSMVSVAALGCVVAILIAAITEAPLQRAETWALLWICLGMSLSAAPDAPQPDQVRRRGSRLRVALRSAVAVTVFAVVTWLALRPVLATSWSHVGERRENAGDDRAAIDAYRRALSCDATASSAAFNLPRALAASGDLDAASAAALAGLRWIDEPELHLLYARILEARGARLEALEQALAAARRFPYASELQQEVLKLASGAASQ